MNYLSSFACLTLFLVVVDSQYDNDLFGAASSLGDCASRQDCNNHGACRNRKCFCDGGWMGRYCATSACRAIKCLNGQVCIGQNQCGFSRNRAGDDYVYNPPVYNYEPEATPPPPQTGACSPPCVNGFCNGDGFCECNAGFSGNDCSIRRVARSTTPRNTTTTTFTTTTQTRQLLSSAPETGAMTVAFLLFARLF